MASFKDYLSCRPTEVPEDDVLLCESRYIETEKQMKKFKGLKRFPLSAKVVEDETYYFRSVWHADRCRVYAPARAALRPNPISTPYPFPLPLPLVLKG